MDLLVYVAIGLGLVVAFFSVMLLLAGRAPAKTRTETGDPPKERIEPEKKKDVESSGISWKGVMKWMAIIILVIVALGALAFLATFFWSVNWSFLHEIPKYGIVSGKAITLHPFAAWEWEWILPILAVLAVLAIIAWSSKKATWLKTVTKILFGFVMLTLAIDLLNAYLPGRDHSAAPQTSAREMAQAVVPPPACVATRTCKLLLNHVDTSGIRQSDRKEIPKGYCLNIADETGASPVRSGRVQLYTWNFGTYQGSWTDTHPADATNFAVATSDPAVDLDYWFVPTPPEGC
jgi:hypothetical protein